MTTTITQSRIYLFLEKILFPVVLLLYPLKHIWHGVEWWDTGYNYANFTYIENMDPMWYFSTYLANRAGNLLTKLPFGDTMLGMNVYTGLSVSLLALGGYLFFIKKVKLPSWLVFVGEIIAVGLCWCPTALLYNYITYLLLFAATILLYQALTTEKQFWFVLAGICLGVNVFVRFSNLAQAAMILAVWVYAWILKKQWKTILSWTGWSLLGYLLGLGVVFGSLCLRYGAEEYISSIQRLFDMSKEASGYTMSSMVLYQLRNYLANIQWLVKMLPFVLLGMAGFAVLPHKFIKIKKIGFVLGIGLVFYWLMNQDMFNMKYSTKLSVFQWAVCLLTFTMVAGTLVILSKKAAKEDKLLCGLSMLIAVLTPLGSNNHLYSSMNNLFFGAPVILWILWKNMRKLPKEMSFKIFRKDVYLFLYPVRAAIAMVLLMLLIQSIGFGFGYVFSESDGGENLYTKIENSDILKNMYTDDVRAEQLGSLLSYVQEHGLQGRELILYGNIPALSYYLEMPFVMSPWPDLPSYTYEVMEEDMEEIKVAIEAGNKAPVIILEAAYGKYVMTGEATPENKKFTLLMEFAWKHNYKVEFANDKFVLLERSEEQSR